jgi:phage-related protein
MKKSRQYAQKLTKQILNQGVNVLYHPQQQQQQLLLLQLHDNQQMTGHNIQKKKNKTD